jgi:hypothetical protein
VVLASAFQNWQLHACWLGVTLLHCTQQLLHYCIRKLLCTLIITLLIIKLEREDQNSVLGALQHNSLSTAGTCWPKLRSSTSSSCCYRAQPVLPMHRCCCAASRFPL